MIILLRKDRFPELRKSKLMPRADGPFKIIKKINDNAYQLELPADFGVSPTFNISDLKPYVGEEDDLESRTTPIQEGEDDEDITPSDTRTTQNPPCPGAKLQGPMTRARARHLNYEVSSFLGANNLSMQNGMLPNICDLLLLRNNGEDPNHLRLGPQGLRPGLPALRPDPLALRPGLKLYDQSTTRFPRSASSTTSSL